MANIINIEKARKNFKDVNKKTDTIFDIKTDTKTNNQNQGDGGTYIGGGASLQDAGGTYDGGMHSAEGGFENTGGGGASYDNAAETGAKDGFGYGLKYGGLVSIL